MPRGRHGVLGAALELAAPPLLEGSSVARAAVIAFWTAEVVVLRRLRGSSKLSDSRPALYIYHEGPDFWSPVHLNESHRRPS